MKKEKGWEKIDEDIKNGEFKSVYLLYGEEKFMRAGYLKKLLAALEVSDDSMNYTRFEGKVNVNDIIGICDTMPFFADRRVVVVDDSALFKSKNDDLAAYLEKLPEYVVLIFNEQEADARLRLYKAAASAGRAIEFSALDENDISARVVSELKRNGKKIRKTTFDYFYSGTGSDMSFIFNELEKLICYACDRDEITINDVNAVCSVQIENRIFEMIDDVSEGKRGEALKIYHDLILLKEPPMKILALIERQFKRLLEIRQLMDGGAGAQLIADTLGMRPFVVKKNLPAARKYSERELRGFLEEAAGLDEDVKSGRINDRIAVELLLMNT